MKVFVAFPKRAADGLAHLARLARILHVEREPHVRELLKRGYEVIREAEEARARIVPLRTFCPIWMDPLMTIHGETFISDMLDLAGAQNVFVDRERRYPLAADLGKAKPLPAEKTAGRDVRYPRVTLDEVVERAPELVLLPDEPHPFTEEDADVFRALADPGRLAERRRSHGRQGSLLVRRADHRGLAAPARARRSLSRIVSLARVLDHALVTDRSGSSGPG